MVKGVFVVSENPLVIEEVTRRNIGLRAEIDALKEKLLDAKADTMEAGSERNQLLEDLRRFGRHTEGCGFLSHDLLVCDCGLSDALRYKGG